MAFYNDKEDEEGQSGAPGGEQVGAQAVGGSTISGSGSGQGATKAPGAPDHGAGNFVGIQTYLNANKPQAAKLGDQAAGVINTSANNAKQSLGGLQNQFNEKAGNGVASDANALAKVGNAETLNDQEKQTLKNQYNAQYTGPKDLTDANLSQGYQDASSKLSLAQQNAQASGTEAGRMGLIGQINNKARTQGQTTFDNALLSAGGGRQKLADAALANKDVGTNLLEKANADAMAKAQSNKQLTDQTRQQTQQAVGGAQEGLQKGIDQRLQDAIQSGLGMNNRITPDIADGDDKLSQETADLFGLKSGDRTFGLDLNSYLKQADINGVNKDNIANSDEYARAQALADLSGGDSYLDQSKAGMAGTGQAAASVDKARLAQDMAAKQQAYNTNYANAKGFSGPTVGSGTSSWSPYGMQYTTDNPLAGIENAGIDELKNSWLPKVQQLEASGEKGSLTQANGNQVSSSAIQQMIDNWTRDQGYNHQIQIG